MFRVLTNHIAFSKCRPCSLYHLRYRATAMAVTLHDLELRMVTRIIGDQAMAANSALLWLTVRRSAPISIVPGRRVAPRMQTFGDPSTSAKTGAPTASPIASSTADGALYFGHGSGGLLPFIVWPRRHVCKLQSNSLAILHGTVHHRFIPARPGGQSGKCRIDRADSAIGPLVAGAPSEFCCSLHSHLSRWCC